MNFIFMFEMYFSTYLFLLYTLPPFLPAQYFSSELLIEVLEKWETMMDIGVSRQTDAGTSAREGLILRTD